MAKAVESTVSRLSTRTKTEPKVLPKGSKILTQTETVEVEEIENGFLLCKCFDIKYEYPNGDGKGMSTDYAYYTLKFYSKDNPISVKLENVPKKGLADVFDTADKD